MKKVFVYGILMRDYSGKEFGIQNTNIMGRAWINGWKRRSLSSITKSNDGNKVIGELIYIPDELEKELYEFECSFRYHREVVKANVDGNVHKSIAYIPDR